MDKRELTEASYKADTAYQQELVRVYGKKLASDMRYQPHKFTDAALIAAANAKVAADKARMAV
jgi:hypothetical protein